MRAQLKCFATIYLLLAVAFTTIKPAFAQEEMLADKARRSIMYVWFDVTDPTTGVNSKVQGTGFVVSKSGYVLTASELFRDWQKQTETDKNKNQIMCSLRDKPGRVTESPLILQPINLGNAEQEDVALLKLPDSVQTQNVASVCWRDEAAMKVGDKFLAYGFPQDQSFQPVDGTLGTRNAPGGRWMAAAPFTYGMSGGPVYSRTGSVIGLVHGGFSALPSVNWITPIRHAKALLEEAGFQEDCGAPPTPDFCGSGIVTKSETQDGGDGKLYSVYFDFTHGKEKIDQKACGRQIWTLQDESDPWFGWKYVYLVNGKKRIVSTTLYIESDDGGLEKWK